jgi:hypothetical protein
MGSALPLGVFARNRRDWQLDELAIGTAQGNGGANGEAQYCLYNPSNLGLALAVFGVLAHRSGYDQLMQAWPVKGDLGGNVGNIAMIDSTGGMIDGVVESKPGSLANAPAGVTFKADGRNWLTLGDIPIFIILPTWRLWVGTQQTIGNEPASDPSFVTFVWGYYKRPKVSVLRTLLG